MGRFKYCPLYVNFSLESRRWNLGMPRWPFNWADVNCKSSCVVETVVVSGGSDVLIFRYSLAGLCAPLAWDPGLQPTGRSHCLYRMNVVLEALNDSPVIVRLIICVWWQQNDLERHHSDACNVTLQLKCVSKSSRFCRGCSSKYMLYSVSQSLSWAIAQHVSVYFVFFFL